MPCQWAAAGYGGAIQSDQTICGTLFGTTVFLGYLYGEGASAAPVRNGETRMQARSAVRALFDGFIERFGSTICLDLTGVRFSDPAESERYFVEKVYEGRCLRYMEYVIGYGLGQAARMGAIRGAEDGADEG